MAAPKLATTTEFKIEKGVPTPVSARGQYPFAEMDIGDSIFFRGMTSQSVPCNAARMWGARNSVKFTCRNVDGGVRIWRIA